MTYTQILAALRAGNITWFDALQQLAAIFGPGGAVAGPTGIDPVQYARQFLEQNGFPEPGAQGPGTQWPDLGEATGAQGPGVGLDLPQDPRSEAERNRAQAFIEQEQEPKDVFSQFMALDPRTQGLSSMGRFAMSQQLNPLFTAFKMAAPLEGQFRDFLGGGGKALTPAGYRQGFTQIGNLFNQPEGTVTPDQQALMERFTNNPSAFGAYLGPLLSRISPIFRTSVSNVAQRLFDQWQGTSPEKPWIQELARRGGSLFQ